MFFLVSQISDGHPKVWSHMGVLTYGGLIKHPQEITVSPSRMILGRDSSGLGEVSARGRPETGAAGPGRRARKQVRRDATPPPEARAESGLGASFWAGSSLGSAGRRQRGRARGSGICRKPQGTAGRIWGHRRRFPDLLERFGNPSSPGALHSRRSLCGSLMRQPYAKRPTRREISPPRHIPRGNGGSVPWKCLLPLGSVFGLVEVCSASWKCVLPRGSVLWRSGVGPRGSGFVDLPIPDVGNAVHGVMAVSAPQTARLWEPVGCNGGSKSHRTYFGPPYRVPEPGGRPGRSGSRSGIWEIPSVWGCRMSRL